MSPAANDDLPTGASAGAVEGIYCPATRSVMLWFNGAVVRISEAEAEALHGAIGGALAVRDLGKTMKGEQP
jgi:hypothetical protein